MFVIMMISEHKTTFGQIYKVDINNPFGLDEINNQKIMRIPKMEMPDETYESVSVIFGCKWERACTVPGIPKRVT